MSGYFRVTHAGLLIGAAGMRLLHLAKFVDLCELPSHPDDSFWHELKQVMDFLHPFQVATDVIQADNSTLYSVWTHFCKLLHYVDTLPSHSVFSTASRSVHNIIVENWEPPCEQTGCSLLCMVFI